MLGHFKGLNRKMGVGENLGVLINVKVMQSTVDADHRRRLLENTDNRCFGQAISGERSYGTKYPGGNAVQERLD